jgi:hypothetical protein
MSQVETQIVRKECNPEIIVDQAEKSIELQAIDLLSIHERIRNMPPEERQQKNKPKKEKVESLREVRQRFIKIMENLAQTSDGVWSLEEADGHIGIRKIGLKNGKTDKKPLFAEVKLSMPTMHEESVMFEGFNKKLWYFMDTFLDSPFFIEGGIIG